MVTKALNDLSTFFDINKDAKLICLSSFFVCFGTGLYSFFLPIKFQQLNATPVEIGYLYAALYLSSGISILLGGFLADRFDMRKTMILSSLLWFPAPLLFGFATNWQQLWLPMILNGTFFEMAAISAYFVKSNPKKIIQTFGLWSALSALGNLISPAIGGTLSDLYGQQITFLISAIFLVLTVLPLFFIKAIPKEKRDNKQTTPLLSKNSNNLVLVCVFFTLVMFLIFPIQSLFAEFTSICYSQSVFNLGVFGTLTVFGSIFFSFGVGQIVEKTRKINGIALLIIISCISLTILSIFSDFRILCFSSFLLGASSSLIFFTSGIIAKKAPKQSVGKWTSFYQASATGVGCFAPMVGGWLFAISPYLEIYFIIMLLFILAVIALFMRQIN